VAVVRTWGASGAAAAIRRAQAVSAHAERTGCCLAEADEAVSRQWSRRRFLQSTGAAAAAIPAVAAARRAGAASRRPGSPGGGRVVIAGAGIAGLGCAYRLWRRYGIRSDVYEYNTLPGGRIRTLRGYFEDGQIVEEHAEFINPEHTATLALASNFGLTLDNCDKYPPGTHPLRETMRFHDHRWPQAALNRDWHEWAWKLFHHAAFTVAPWPQLYNHHNKGGLQFDHMSVTEWIDRYIPGGAGSDFGALCISAVLDEYGGPADEESALNLVYLLGQDSSTRSGAQPRGTPALGGGDEKWHIHDGNDQLISGLLERLPGGVLHLGQRLVAVRPAGHGYVCTFQSGTATKDVPADHLVLAMPFTTMRLVDLGRVAISPLHRRAIETEPLGTNSKFFLQFSSRVWNAEHTTGNCYCGGVVQGGWDPTVYQPGKAGILVALPGGAVGADWGSRYRLPGYLGRPPADMTRAYLDGFDQLFPGVSKAWNGLGYYVWSPGDPHILGAYSYLKPGQYTGFNGIQGQREGNLHFAGEQTSVNFQGYIEGGLRSGYRCATEIAG
jgi:monoamine oxidase